MIQHDLQQVHISRLLHCVFSTPSLLFAYSRKWRSLGFKKITLEQKMQNHKDLEGKLFWKMEQGNTWNSPRQPSRIDLPGLTLEKL